MSFISDPTREQVPLIKITAYKKIARGNGDKVDSLLLPFDVQSFISDFQNNIVEKGIIGASSGAAGFQQAPPSELKVTFVLDDSTYENLVAFNKPRSSISDRVDEIVKKLFTLCHSVCGETHEPYYLILKPLHMPLANSGAGGFRCRLKDMKVDNKLVDTEGNRIKAMVNCTFIECLSQKQRDAADKKNSPDLTHVRQVLDGESLPLKTYNIYDDPGYYLNVAEFNKLDSLRDLKVGDSLVFPPLER